MGHLVWGASVAVGETVILSEDDGKKLSKTSKAKATQTLTYNAWLCAWALFTKPLHQKTM